MGGHTFLPVLAIIFGSCFLLYIVVIQLRRKKFEQVASFLMGEYKTSNIFDSGSIVGNYNGYNYCLKLTTPHGNPRGLVTSITIELNKENPAEFFVISDSSSNFFGSSTQVMWADETETRRWENKPLVIDEKKRGAVENLVKDIFLQRGNDQVLGGMIIATSKTIEWQRNGVVTEKEQVGRILVVLHQISMGLT